MERRPGHWSQKCGSHYLTCLTVAFPSQIANTRTKFKSSFPKGEESTLPCGTSKHAKSEYIHPSGSSPPDNVPQGCLAKSSAPHLLLSGELVGILEEPSTAQLLFIGYFHLASMTCNGRAMSHCPAIISVTFFGSEVLSLRTCSKMPSSRLSSCQNMKIHHTDRFSLRTPSA